MKNKSIFLIIGTLLCILLTSTIVFNLSDNAKESGLNMVNPSDKAREFNSQNALDFTKIICKLGPRYGGNGAELKAADIMENEFKKNGLETHKEKIDLGDGKYTYNIVGEIKGSENPNKYIIIGSHIDSPGFCEGATDDAAAVGIQIEMARVLSNDFKPKKTVLIIGFGGEELWFKGSDDFVKKHPDIIKNCEAMIDLNCVGAGENVFLNRHSNQPTPVEGDSRIMNLLEQCARELGHSVAIGDTTYPSDTYPFYYNNIKKVPVCQVMSQPFKVSPWNSANTVDKLNPKDIVKIGETVTMAVINLTMQTIEKPSAKQITSASYLKDDKSAQNNSIQDTGCCSVIIHVQSGHDVIAYRRDSEYPADIIVEKINFNGQSAIKEYKTQKGYFCHTIITENGWIISIGGKDDPNTNKQLEKLGSDIISQGKIERKDVEKANVLINRNQWGHFVIKSPDDDVGIAAYDSRVSSTITRLFKMKDGEFIKVPNNPRYYNYGKLNKLNNNPVDTAIKIIGSDPYGIERRDIITYELINDNDSKKINIWASFDGGTLIGRSNGNPDNILFINNKIRSDELPRIPDKKFLGKEILQNYNKKFGLTQDILPVKSFAMMNCNDILPRLIIH